MSISSVRNVCSNSSSAQDKTTTKRKTSESFEASKEETFVSVEVLKEKVMSQYEQSKASFMQVLNNKDTLSSDERIALINEAQALKNEIKGSVLKYYGVVFEVTKTFTEKNGEDLKKINTLFSRKNSIIDGDKILRLGIMQAVDREYLDQTQKRIYASGEDNSFLPELWKVRQADLTLQNEISAFTKDLDQLSNQFTKTPTSPSSKRVRSSESELLRASLSPVRSVKPPLAPNSAQKWKDSLGGSPVREGRNFSAVFSSPEVSK